MFPRSVRRYVFVSFVPTALTPHPTNTGGSEKWCWCVSQQFCSQWFQADRLTRSEVHIRVILVQPVVFLAIDSLSRQLRFSVPCASTYFHSHPQLISIIRQLQGFQTNGAVVYHSPLASIPFFNWDCKSSNSNNQTIKQFKQSNNASLCACGA